MPSPPEPAPGSPPPAPAADAAPGRAPEIRALPIQAAPRSRRRRWLRRGTLLIALPGILFGLSRLHACASVGPRSPAEQIAALSRQTVPAAGDLPEMSYLRGGDPSLPRVLYIHGTPGNAHGWADFLVDPVPGLESVAVDRPGFGESGPKGAVPGFKQQSDAIARLLEVRNGRGTILVGHSLGGPIAAWIAAEHPDKVAGLIIVAGSLDPKLEEPGIMQRIATTGLARAFMPRAIDNSMGELDAAMSQTKLLAPLLSRITCPVIVIHGTTDALVPYANVAYIERMMTGARSLSVVTLKGQGHFVTWETPEVIREAVMTVQEGNSPD